MSTAAERELAARVAARSRGHDDERAMRIAMLAEIRRSVGFDAYAWLLTDPETEVGCAPLADVPCLPELPRLIRLKYLTAINRWTTLTEPASLRTTTEDQPERSLVWRELLSDHGVSDVASVVFRDRHGCWGFLDLWRTSGALFTHDEMRRLGLIAPPVCAALRQCVAETFASSTAPPTRAGPVALVLSPALEVRAQTPATEDYLRMLVPPDGDRRPVPAGAYNVAAQLLAQEAGIDGHEASARVPLAGGIWLQLRAARLDAADPAADIAVTIESCTPAGRRGIYVRACGLSAREAEVVEHLVAGADTRAVAERMYVSEHTVQDHLKSIFTKTGTRNRRTLLTRLAGA